MITQNRRTRNALVAAALGLFASSGCQQKMADQPAPRPFEQSSMFTHGQSARPIVSGVIHRNQPLSDDPLVTWLTPAGKEPKHNPNYETWLRTPQAKLDSSGRPVLGNDNKPVMISPLSDTDIQVLLAQKPQPGSPTDAGNFVSETPFAMTQADYERGQVLYNAVCAECHGGAGHANGKIPERGFLRPPSYHTDAEGKAKDWSKYVSKDGPTVGPDYTGNPQGTSRNFYKYGIEIPLKDVPIGYIYQVIYWGYGGMASHEIQIPRPDDRWRVAAYVRALQLSQAADASKLSPDLKKKIDDAGKPKAETKKAGDH